MKQIIDEMQNRGKRYYRREQLKTILDILGAFCAFILLVVLAELILAIL